MRTRHRARREGRPDALPHALSRSGFCPSLARGATKPRPLAPGAPRRRSSEGGARGRRRGSCAAQARHATCGPPPRGRRRERRPLGGVGPGPAGSCARRPPARPPASPSCLLASSLPPGPSSPGVTRTVDGSNRPSYTDISCVFGVHSSKCSWCHVRNFLLPAVSTQAVEGP